jgi:uncharacterized alpha/beta hydrolase family protein
VKYIPFMRNILTILIFGIQTILVGQTNNNQEELVSESNLPEQVRDFYYQEKIKNDYALRANVIQVYINGDFDGDKTEDYAIGVVERGTTNPGF